jgi:hypothetical protein
LNQSLIPNSGIVVNGTGNHRSAYITPAANQSGTATITLTVSDGVLSASRSFNVTVMTLNLPLLRIDRVGPNVVLSWPSSAAGFFLESRPDMTYSWSSVPEVPFLSAGRYHVTNALSGVSKIYQLSRPVPRLSIITTGPNITISWPAAVSGFTLESSPNARPAGPWTTVPNVPTVNGNVQSVTLSRGPGPQFFRLRK